MVAPVASVHIVLDLPGGAVLAPDVGDPGLLQSNIVVDIILFVWSGVTLKDISMKTPGFIVNT